MDERLRVHGVKDPRVVDASVFQVMPRGVSSRVIMRRRTAE